MIRVLTTKTNAPVEAGGNGFSGSRYGKRSNLSEVFPEKSNKSGVVSMVARCAIPLVPKSQATERREGGELFLKGRWA